MDARSSIMAAERVDRRSRLIEIAISVSASMISSSLVAAWTMSGLLSDLRNKQAEHDRVLTNNTQEIRALNTRDMMQISQQAASDAHYQDILRRLDSIDRKLEVRQ